MNLELVTLLHPGLTNVHIEMQGLSHILAIYGLEENLRMLSGFQQ